MKNPVAQCGTRSGYNRHLRLGEEVCWPCRSAQRQYDLKRFYENPEIKRERNRKYSNPERKREAWRRREAKRRGNEMEKYRESDVLDKYGRICHLCKKEIDLNASRRSGIGENWEMGLNIDHVFPISLGGSDTIDNVRPSHVICNLRKGSRVD